METYTYFATDPVSGWEHYTQAAGVKTATGALGNLANGSVRVEVWRRDRLHHDQRRDRQPERHPPAVRLTR